MMKIGHGNIRHVIDHQPVLPCLGDGAAVQKKVAVHRLRPPAVVVIRVGEQKLPDLSEIPDAVDGPPPFPGCIQGRKQKRRKNCDDRNRNQKLDQREARPADAFHIPMFSADGFLPFHSLSLSIPVTVLD